MNDGIKVKIKESDVKYGIVIRNIRFFEYFERMLKALAQGYANKNRQYLR